MREATRPEETDWSQIALLYARLARMTPSPVVELNQAVAIAMLKGPLEGLAPAGDSRTWRAARSLLSLSCRSRRSAAARWPL